jgi:hypothetical protein
MGHDELNEHQPIPRDTRHWSHPLLRLDSFEGTLRSRRVRDGLCDGEQPVPWADCRGKLCSLEASIVIISNETGL